MRAIVIYFSQTGNTRLTADSIADSLSIVSCAINSDTNPDATFFDEYSDFIIGSPIHDGRMPEAFTNFLSGINWTGRRIFPFYTMGGYLGEVDYQLSKLCKGASIKRPVRFQFMEGKCEDLADKIQDFTTYIKTESHLF